MIKLLRQHNQKDHHSQETTFTVSKKWLPCTVTQVIEVHYHSVTLGYVMHYHIDYTQELPPLATSPISTYTSYDHRLVDTIFHKTTSSIIFLFHHIKFEDSHHVLGNHLIVSINPSDLKLLIFFGRGNMVDTVATLHAFPFVCFLFNFLFGIVIKYISS